MLQELERATTTREALAMMDAETQSTATPDPISQTTDPTAPATGADSTAASSPSIQPDPSGSPSLQTGAVENPPATAPTPAQNLLRLSTFDLDIDKLRAGDPNELAKISRHDEILRQTQATAERLRNGKAETEPTNGHRPTPPAPPQPKEEPNPPVTQSDIDAAHDKFIETGEKEDAENWMGLRDQLNEWKITQRLQKENQGMLVSLVKNLREQGYLLDDDGRSLIAKERASRQAEIFQGESDRTIERYVRMGVDIKSIDRKEVATAFREMIEYTPEWNRVHGTEYDIRDPEYRNAVIDLAIDAVKNKKVSGQTTAPAVAPTRAVGGSPVNPPVLPKVVTSGGVAPFSGSVPSGATNGKTQQDSWGGISKEQLAGMPMSEVMKILPRQ